MNRIWMFIINDYPRKLLALVFAVFLYIGISGQVFQERSLPGVPVEVTLSPELSFATAVSHQVTITVQGSERVLRELNPEAFAGSVYVGPEHWVNGDLYQVSLRPEMFKRKPGVKIVQVPPLKLHLQRRISKRVKVKAQLSGQLADEFRCSEVLCIPGEVMVSGSEMTLQSLNTLFTEPIPLSENVSDSFEFESRIVAPGDIQINPKKVLVQVNIVRNFEQKRVRQLPILLMQSNDTGLRAELADPVQKAEVTLSGLSTRIAVLNPQDLRLFADLSDIDKPGIYTVPLRCSCAVEGIGIRSITPGEVKVKVIKLPK